MPHTGDEKRGYGGTPPTPPRPAAQAHQIIDGNLFSVLLSSLSQQLLHHLPFFHFSLPVPLRQRVPSSNEQTPWILIRTRIVTEAIASVSMQ